MLHLLEVEGANGQSVPYLGYIELNVTFPSDLLGSAISIDTLALVVPDLKESQSMILPSATGYRAVLTILQHRHRHSLDDQSAPLLLNQPCTISAGQTTVLEGVLVTRSLQGEKAVIIEHPVSHALPGGLIVKACIADLPRHRPCHLPVIVANESDHAVTIPARSIIAETCPFTNIHNKQHSIHPVQSNQSTTTPAPLR